MRIKTDSSASVFPDKFCKKVGYCSPLHKKWQAVMTLPAPESELPRCWVYSRAVFVEKSFRNEGLGIISSIFGKCNCPGRKH